MDRRRISAIILAAAIMAQPPSPARAGSTAVSEVVIERLRQRRNACIEQKAQTDARALRLQSALAREKRPAKRQKMEKELTALIVSLAETEARIENASVQIAEYESLPAAGLPADEREQESDSVKIEYKISAHDELQINVYGEPDLTKTVRVAVDGNISYPMLGRIKVDGLTTQELEDKIGGLLSGGGYIIKPQVSVYMEKFSTISILGEVRNPGSYELKGRFGILDAVAQAGGFNIDADINNVKILRVEAGEQKTIQLRLGDIKKGVETVEITLKPNDTIFVEKIGKVTVLGEVARPGTFELKDRLSVLEAIAMAGGFTDVAAVNSTRIIRDIQGAKNIIRIKVTDVTRRGRREKDIELEPGDIIYVPESLF